ncbi:ketoacyl-synthetase C-terminal extension domain-containing protein [uncultured Roseibium sp.]|uniref:ketoacyl-synthetase C-terminal extension domain-containing protein n=1 Tax=uncultured Roseibium sp. TaxID=1936171 RepID=UPI003216A659
MTHLPKSLHFNTPNPDIPFEELNLKVASEQIALARSDKPRLAGINSFGFGGTNAHTVIADGDPEPVADDAVSPSAPLVLSARSKDALKELAVRYRDRLKDAGRRRRRTRDGFRRPCA